MFPLLCTFPQSYFPIGVNCGYCAKVLLKDDYQMLSFSDELSVIGEPDTQILVLYHLGLWIEGKCSVYYLNYLYLKQYLCIS